MKDILFIAVPLAPMLLGVCLWLVPALRDEKARNRYVMCSLTLCLALVAALCLLGDGDATLFTIAGTIPVAMRSDGLGRLFALMAACMWLNSGAFSFGYMRGDRSASRFYAFYLLTLGALLGLAFSGTLVTMYLFFELTTLLSVALVMHSMTAEAIAAGVKYLIYSIAGAMMGLLGIFYFTANTESALFTAGGSLSGGALAGGGTLLWVLFITIIGFGTKAGMFPMHGWLPTAHPIAPAPASAVLSGVITKAGVLCIARVIYFSVGADFMRGTWVQTALLILALITVFMGSMMALKTDGLKKRLAYSSVSQVSYILFGLFLLDKTAFTGALLHMIFHSVMKNGLFLCAGAIILKTGKTDVRELDGVGRRMPVTMWCFTLCGLGLVGVPPLSGFISKWWLARGAIGSAIPVFSWLGPVILLVSALLTAAYLLPVSISAFFPKRGEGEVVLAPESCEVGARMWLPLVALAGLTLLFGLWQAPLMSLIEAVAASVL